MYNLVIVEDEHNIREALVRFVKWQEIGYTIAGVFANGEEALEFIKCNRVNAILTDIRMPVMDGLELTRQLYELYPQIRVVVLSGYDDFSYAQQSIRNGVVDYILKPVKFPSLTEAFIRVKEALDKQRKDTSALNETLGLLREQFFNNLIKGYFNCREDVFSRAEELGLDIRSERYCLVRVEIDSYYSNDNWFNDRNLLKFSVRNILEEIVAKYGIGYVFSNDIPELCVFVKDAGDMSGLGGKFKEFRECVMQFTKQGVTVAISPEYEDILMSFEANGNAGRKLECKFFYDNSGIIPSMDDGSLQGDRIVLPDDREAEQVVQLLNLKDLEGIKGLIRSKFDKVVKDTGVGVDNLYLFYSFFLLVLSRYLRNVGKDINSLIKDQSIECRNLREYRSPEEILGFVMSLYEGALNYSKLGDKGERKIIEKVKDYIKEHYHEEITLETIAGYVYMNPSYLSRLFKTETGENFIDHLSRIRVEKAMGLLQGTNLKIYEVANMVGYSNYRHFTEVFKKFTGVTAVEFRDGKNS